MEPLVVELHPHFEAVAFPVVTFSVVLKVRPDRVFGHADVIQDAVAEGADILDGLDCGKLLVEDRSVEKMEDLFVGSGNALLNFADVNHGLVLALGLAGLAGGCHGMDLRLSYTILAWLVLEPWWV